MAKDFLLDVLNNIWYFRTETNKFPTSINLQSLVTEQSSSVEWGNFSTEILSRGGPSPRNGNKSDEAHPPIHPLKLVKP